MILSFVVASVVVRPAFRRADRPGRPLVGAERLRRARGGRTVASLQAASVAALALVVAAGLAGSPIAAWNPAPLLLATLGAVGLPALQILVGDVWRVVNPWAAVFAWERARRGGSAAPPPLAYPERLGAWPAVLLLALGVWSLAVTEELAPRALAALLAAYSLVTWSGMTVFGEAPWLERVEVTSVLLGLLSWMAPIQARRAGGETVALDLHPPVAGLAAPRAVGADVLAFVLVLVGGGFARALLDTRLWPTLWLALGDPLAGAELLRATLGLVAVTLLVAATYALACHASGLVACGPLGAGAVLRALAPSLLPVAAGLHFALALAPALEAAQLLLRAVSDPLGLGWDALGTRAWPIARLDLFTLWHGQVALVVLGHVAAVWAAHLRALTLCRDHRTAVRSQLPMLALMLLYTLAALWLLSTVPVIVAD